MRMQALWRRLDGPGHASATIVPNGDGLRLMGNAAFDQDGEAAGLAYVVEMAADGVALSGRVRGFVGAAIIDQTIQRLDGDWWLNGRPQGLKGVVDLDFGFTPATNWQQVKRMRLAVGERAQVDVAWWDVGEVRLIALPQIYERTGDLTYAYAAPTFGYAAILTMAPSGFVAEYPGLWTLTGPDAGTG
ncbi:putative glycolipid-binding domain-containing protein [soil metagenome]